MSIWLPTWGTIRAHEAAGRLVAVVPRSPRDSVVRPMFLIRELYQTIYGPHVDAREEDRYIRLQADLEVFVTGQLVTSCVQWSQEMSMSSQERVSSDDIIYYRQRQRNRVFSAVVGMFSRLAETQGLTKKELAFRLGKEPAQISRWLSGPGNWTLDTVSDLLLAMGCELDQEVVSTQQRDTKGESHPLGPKGPLGKVG